MRLAAILGLAMLVLSCCGGDDDTERPEESAHPEMTAAEILDRISDSEGGSHVLISRQSIGDSKEAVTRTLVAGADAYMKDDDSEFLSCDGAYYSRSTGEIAWREDTGFATFFGSLNDPAEFGSFPEDLLDPEEGSTVRLDDAVIDGTHSLHISSELSSDWLTDLQTFFSGFWNEYWAAQVDATPLATLPQRLTFEELNGVADFWIDPLSFRTLRSQVEFTGENDVGQPLSMSQTIDFHAGTEELPLPDAMPAACEFGGDVLTLRD